MEQPVVTGAGHNQDVALVVGPGRTDGAGVGLVARAHRFGVEVTKIEEFRLFHARGDLAPADVVQLAEALLVDPVGQWWTTAADHQPDGLLIEVGLRPGVTDREGAELVRGAAALGLDVEAATVGRRYLVTPLQDEAGGVGKLTEDEIDVLANRVLHNEVIERWACGSLPAAFTDSSATSGSTTFIDLRRATPAELAAVNQRRRLGLDPEEMLAIQAHFAAVGRDPSDAELETLAQTWSEHCAHKTFRAKIDVTDEAGGKSEIDGLLKSLLRKATDEIDAAWVHSAFVDNAGIVAFEPGWDIALKAETHNHPSALEPFGGANTGVGGVVRDILGVSAKPIAVTDMLCFGPTDVAPESLPDGVLHPARIREGVIAGVGDYGNKIGVPNVAGAIVHDPAYTTTPLVFAGCFGLLPEGSNPTQIAPGDAIVVLGGAVGRDGVGGATFSSQTMGAETAEIAGSSVQIGDPIVEKGLIDVVMEARDQQLYSAITDCGAGGLSSAVGEMAEVLGADVDLQLVPRKYPGLAAWEVWLSEAQERMVVAATDPEPLIALAQRWAVGVSVIGTFTGDGRLVVRDGAGADPIIDLEVGFLHDGRPQRQMEARLPDTSRGPRIEVDVDASTMLLALLAHPSIRSNEDVVRTYDHEVLGATMVRPYGGVAGDGPADGTVIIPPGTSGTRGMALGIGVNAAIGSIDPEAMAWNVIDEAIRNVVVAGADPGELSLLDNFAWGNPTDPETLGEIVAACRACRDASLNFGAPFVSGKDSLYNVFVPPDGDPDPVAPTLMITAVGLVKNLDVVPVTGVVEAGNDVWLVGEPSGALGGSHLDLVLGEDHGGAVPPIDPGALARHREVAAAIGAGLIVSAHDVSEGGTAVAAAEWAIAGRLGLDLELSGSTDRSGGRGPAVLFGERCGRYLLEVAPDDAARLSDLVPSATRVGSVTADPTLCIGTLKVDIATLLAAYTGHHQAVGHLPTTAGSRP